jgi:hypothetical protein
MKTGPPARLTEQGETRKLVTTNILSLNSEESAMKKQALIVVSLCLFVGLAVVRAYSQAGGVQVQAKVPFEFVISGKTFPAGEYTMVACPLGVAIQDEHGITIATVLASDISGRSASVNGQIVFHCYNDRHCFLSEVWSPRQDTGRQLLISGAEADLAKEESKKEVAVLGEMALK